MRPAPGRAERDRDLFFDRHARWLRWSGLPQVLGHSAFALLLHLLEQADQFHQRGGSGAYFSLTLPALSRLTGMSEKTVRRQLTVLESARLVEVKSGGGRGLDIRLKGLMLEAVFLETAPYIPAVAGGAFDLRVRPDQARPFAGRRIWPGGVVLTDADESKLIEGGAAVQERLRQEADVRGREYTRRELHSWLAGHAVTACRGVLCRSHSPTKTSVALCKTECPTKKAPLSQADAAYSDNLTGQMGQNGALPGQIVLQRKIRLLEEYKQSAVAPPQVGKGPSSRDRPFRAGPSAERRGSAPYMSGGDGNDARRRASDGGAAADAVRELAAHTDPDAAATAKAHEQIRDLLEKYDGAESELRVGMAKTLIAREPNLPGLKERFEGRHGPGSWERRVVNACA